MKTLFTITLCLIFSFQFQLFAQEGATYFNEWIDYEQTYHKFYIEEDGLYRIPYSALQENFGGKDFAGLHLFSRGQEIPIYTSSMGDILEDTYIEFYGRKNDGSFDTQMFEDPEWQLTNRQSAFTNLAAYYLMWDDGFEGLRIEEVANDLDTELPEAEKYFLYESTRLYRNIFCHGEPTRMNSMEVNMHFAGFEKGEGFASSIIQGESTRSYSLSSFGLYQDSDAPKASLTTKMIGQNDDFEVDIDHHIKVSINGNTYLDETYGGYDTPIYQTSVELADLSETRTEITYESVGDLFTTSNADWQSIAYTFLTYPRQFDFSVYANNEIQNANEFYFELQHSNEAYFEVNHFNGGANAILYDLTNSQRYTVAAENELYKIHLLQSDLMDVEIRQLFLANPEVGIRTIEDLETLQFTNYEALVNQGNYILLSHPSLREGDTDWVQTYGDYRSSEAGGAYEVRIVNIEELYDQFAEGIQKHPLAIRNFVNFAVDKWSVNPEYLFLMGKGIGYRTTTVPSTFRANLIPTFGHQPSDNILTTRSLNDYRPQLGVGRLSANTPEDVENYFYKIQQYEDIAACGIEEQAWRKNALFQANGDDESQYTTTKSYLESYQPTLENGYFGGKVLDLQAGKNYDPLFTTTPFIEEGIGLLHFFGHSTGEVWKSDVLKNVSAYKQSAPRFPIIFSSSSFTGNVFKSLNSPPSMQENWVLAENKGAIAFLGTVSFHWRQAENVFYTELYRQISQTNYNQPIGKILKETIEALYIADTNDEFYHELRAALEQHAFEGDPALVIGGNLGSPEYVINQGYEYTFIDVEDDYTTKTEIRNDVTLFDASTGEALQMVDGKYDFTGMEEVTLKVRVGNLGKAVEGSIELSVVKKGADNLETLVMSELLLAPTYEMTYELNVPIEVVNALEEYEWLVQISSSFEENCADNNEVGLMISQGSVSIRDVWQGGEIQLYPNPVTNQLRIVSADNEVLQLEIYNLQGAIIHTQTLPNGSKTLNLSNLSNGVYWVRLTGEKGTWSQKVMKQ